MGEMGSKKKKRFRPQFMGSPLSNAPTKKVKGPDKEVKGTVLSSLELKQEKWNSQADMNVGEESKEEAQNSPEKASNPPGPSALHKF